MIVDQALRELDKGELRFKTFSLISGCDSVLILIFCTIKKMEKTETRTLSNIAAHYMEKVLEYVESNAPVILHYQLGSDTVKKSKGEREIIGVKGNASTSTMSVDIFARLTKLQ